MKRWRWESPGEYADRMGITPPTLIKHTETHGTGIVEPGDYERYRRRLCQACGGPCDMETCHFHATPKAGGVEATTHLICRNCGSCVDDTV